MLRIDCIIWSLIIAYHVLHYMWQPVPIYPFTPIFTKLMFLDGEQRLCIAFVGYLLSKFCQFSGLC